MLLNAAGDSQTLEKKIGTSVATSRMNAELPMSYRIQLRSKEVSLNFSFIFYLCLFIQK